VSTQGGEVSQAEMDRRRKQLAHKKDGELAAIQEPVLSHRLGSLPLATPGTPGLTTLWGAHCYLPVTYCCAIEVQNDAISPFLLRSNR
jgi:hypothetical protein